MNFLGIDIAKRSHRFLAIDEQGKNISRPFPAENSQQGFQELLEKLHKLSLVPDNLLCGLEATSNYWENLYSFLTQHHFKVILLNPYHTSKFREALRKKAKTDNIDTLVIAQLLRTGEYGKCLVPEETVQTLRELVKLRYEFVKDRKNYQRQVFSLLQVIFPEFSKTALRNPFACSSTAIFKRFPTAKHLASTSVKQIEKIVRSIQGNNFNIKEIQQLIDTAKNSIYSGRACEARAMSMRMLLTQVETLAGSIQKLDQHIDQILKPKSNSLPPGDNLFSISGVGAKTIAAVLSAAGLKGEAFPNGNQFIGHLGYYPKIYESGQTHKENRMSNRGPKYLRWAIYMAAVAGIKHNPELRTLYNKKISQGKSKKQALVYVGKKLAQMMLSMLKSGEEYNPARVFVVS